MNHNTTVEPSEGRVTLERIDNILIIRLNREDKRNAIDPHMTTAFDAALNQLEEDPDLWCGVLVGGEKAFSAGTDLAEGAGEPTENGGHYGIINRNRRTPLIAAVEGLAFGGGFEIVLSCDMVVAGKSARFGLPEVARGLIPTCGGLFRSWQSLPLTIAKQLVLTGQPLSAERAYELGLLNDLCEDGGALAGALKLAQQVCENSPFAIAEGLSVMQDVISANENPGWSKTAQATAAIIASEDSQEGINAFLEKRAPQWQGR